MIRDANINFMRLFRYFLFLFIFLKFVIINSNINAGVVIVNPKKIFSNKSIKFFFLFKSILFLTKLYHFYYNNFIKSDNLLTVKVGLYELSSSSLFLLNQQLSKPQFMANPTSDLSESPIIKYSSLL